MNREQKSTNESAQWNRNEFDLKTNFTISILDLSLFFRCFQLLCRFVNHVFIIAYLKIGLPCRIAHANTRQTQKYFNKIVRINQKPIKSITMKMLAEPTITQQNILIFIQNNIEIQSK